jgi:putative membrane protein
MDATRSEEKAPESPPETSRRFRASPNPNLLRDRLANERTFLAWLRTGIAITSLGFVVARFDLFLAELTRVSADDAARAAEATDSRAAVPIGVLLVLAGPVIIVMAAGRYLQTERALATGRPESRRLVRGIVVVLTLGAIVAGVALALHILATWPT